MKTRQNILIALAVATTLGIPYGIYRYQKLLNLSKTNNPTHQQTHTPGIKPAVEGLTVFIHGTTGSSLNFCDPVHCFTQSASLDEAPLNQSKKNRAEKIVESYRNHPAMTYDQLLDNEGLVIWKPEATSDRQAATYLIPAYKKMAKITQTSARNETYALFGWNGILSQKARKDAGYRLYHALIDYQKQQQLNGQIEARIRLITHSHGGNVALWLAEAEALYKKGLVIETLIMLGAPIQEETIEFIQSSIFRNIHLCYSTGDSVQRSDCISTGCHKSFARMQDLVDLEAITKKNPALKRHDILLGINQKAEQVTHINMWLSGRSLKLSPAFGPLPFMVLLPVLIKATEVDDIPCQSKLSVDVIKGALYFNFYHNQFTSHLQRSVSWEEENLFYTYAEAPKEVFTILSYWANRMNEEWRPYDKSRNLFWNKKNLEILKSALW
ncbi:TPA: hypothetical protein DCW54_00410 [Candidatus Dependentiae bacterium]|nr:hypothetical protein [Candidatus Dependentiae bacterium]